MVCFLGGDILNVVCMIILHQIHDRTFHCTIISAFSKETSEIPILRISSLQSLLDTADEGPWPETSVMHLTHSLIPLHNIMVI